MERLWLLPNKADLSWKINDDSAFFHDVRIQRCRSSTAWQGSNQYKFDVNNGNSSSSAVRQ